MTECDTGDGVINITKDPHYNSAVIYYTCNGRCKATYIEREADGKLKMPDRHVKNFDDAWNEILRCVNDLMGKDAISGTFKMIRKPKNFEKTFKDVIATGIPENFKYRYSRHF